MAAVEKRCIIDVAGRTDSTEFQQAKAVAEVIGSKYPRDYVSSVTQFTELEWLNHRRQAEEIHGATIRDIVESVFVTIDNKFQPNTAALLEWANNTKLLPTFSSTDVDYSVAAQEAYSKFLASPSYRFVYFDVAIGDSEIGQLVFQLDYKTCPKTCANFIALCEGLETQTEPNLKYANTIFHRLQSDGWIQGGDLFTAPGNAASLSLDGDKGSSLYGQAFEDENYIIKHDDFGILAMANNQSDQNTAIHSASSQFTIAFRAMEWMNKRYVAFGKLASGVNVLKQLQQVKTANGRPIQTCKVVKCGQLGGSDLVVETTANTATSQSVYASMYMHQSWTAPFCLFKGAAANEVKSTRLPDVFATASKIRLSISSGDDESVDSVGIEKLSWNGSALATPSDYTVSSDRKSTPAEISF